MSELRAVNARASFPLLLMLLCSGVLGLGVAPARAAVIGTHEVSYIYHSLASNASYAPINPVEYGSGVFSAPIVVSLAPGDYTLTLIAGRELDNVVDPTVFDAAVGAGALDAYWTSLVTVNNPGAPKYQSGFDGGNTNPLASPNSWFFGTAYWVGASEAVGAGNRFFGLGGVANITVGAGESLWLFWNDNYTKDNLGGVTVEVATGARAVPEPAIALLLVASLLGIALGRSRSRTRELQ